MTTQEFAEFIIKEIVTYPEEVKINQTKDDMGILLTLFLNPEDTGIIIGRKGSTAKTIRSLIHIHGMKNKARVTLKLHETAHKYFNKRIDATSQEAQANS